MPNQTATPIRCHRIPDDLYDEVERIAEDQHVTRTEVVVRALKMYVRLYPASD